MKQLKLKEMILKVTSYGYANKGIVLKILLSSIFLILIYSCTEYASVRKTDSGMYVTPTQLKIVNHKDEVWRVGPLRRQTVSKGFRLDVTFPVFDREDLDDLIMKYGVNAWLIKIRRRSYYVNTVLGYIYIPLVVPGTQEKSKYRRHQIKQGAISVYYAAAALSKRFENFSCPAFEHNKYLDKVDLEERSFNIDSFYVGRQTDEYVEARVEKFSYSGNILNGGQSLEGEYSIQVAMYNSQSKRRKSNFVELKDLFTITREKSEQISGCEGFEIPTKASDEVDKRQLFKFGQ